MKIKFALASQTFINRKGLVIWNNAHMSDTAVPLYKLNMH